MATKQKTTQINTANYIRVSEEAAKALHGLAEESGRTRKHIASEAITAYVERKAIERELMLRKVEAVLGGGK